MECADKKLDERICKKFSFINPVCKAIKIAAEMSRQFLTRVLLAQTRLFTYRTIKITKIFFRLLR